MKSKVMCLLVIAAICGSTMSQSLYAQEPDSDEGLQTEEQLISIPDEELLGNKDIEIKEEQTEEINVIKEVEHQEKRDLELANEEVVNELSLKNVSEVTLDVSSGVIEIDDTGYRQNNGVKVPFTGKYILTGTYATPSTNDRVTVFGGTEDNPIEIVLNNVTIDNTSPNSITTGAALLVGTLMNKSGHVALTLVGNNILNGSEGHPGIEFKYKDEMSTLTIDGIGSLSTKGGAGAAGIGTGNLVKEGKAYQLTINEGTITSQGGQYGAGIGGGKNTNGADITIHGGNVTSTGGQYGAGIGGGTQQSHDQVVYDMLADMSITIDGGIINANGGNFCAGIGTGYIEYKAGRTPENLTPKKMTINIGGTADITANGYNYGAGIGQSYTNFKVSPWIVDQINITGGDITAIGGWGSSGIGGAGYQGKTDGIVEEINITGGNVSSTAGLFAAGIGTGYGTTVNKIQISNATVISQSPVAFNATTDAFDGFGAGIGTGFDGKMDEISIGQNAEVTATGSLYSSGIGRCYSANLANPFPIIIQDSANVTAYAVGDYYADLFKNDPDDANEPTPDAPYITAIDQECLVHAGSSISANVLMGDFKEVPDEAAEKEVIVKNMKDGSSTTLKLPAMYASFATILASSDYQILMDGDYYAGDVTKRNESNLTSDFDVKTVGVNSYWKIQEAYKITYNANGGLLNGSSSLEQGIMYGEVIPALIPTRDGYVFKGWSYKGNVIEATNTYEDLVNDPTIKEIELVAVWEQKAPDVETYIVTFEFNGGTFRNQVNPEFTVSILSDSNRLITVYPFDTMVTKEGYRFTGWYSDAACTKKWDFATDKVSTTMTMYAGWEKAIEPDQPVQPEKPSYPSNPKKPTISDKTDTPKTGDQTNIGMWSTIMIISISGIIIYVFKRKKELNKWK